LEEIDRLRRANADRIEIDVSVQRYQDFPLAFSAYHAAHFLMVVGADRRNYLGAEVKYHPDFVIADLGGELADGFLWDAGRLRRIAGFDSSHYGALGSRHRGVLYNDFVERLIGQDADAQRLLDAPPAFQFPNIL
jgi:hypothetical protein